MIDSKELALKAARLLDQKGATDIDVIEVAHLTSITDYFVIANGRNVQSVRSLAEDLEDKLAEAGVLPRRKEGERESAGSCWTTPTSSYISSIRRSASITTLSASGRTGTNQVEFIPLGEEAPRQ